MPVLEVPPRPAADHKASALQRTLEQSAMNAPVCLEAVLGRVTLPLDKVCKLEPGGLLPFSADRTMQVRLEASQKHVVAVARLGQLNGARAVRLIPGGEDAPCPAAGRHAQPGSGIGSEVAGAPGLDMTRIAAIAEMAPDMQVEDSVPKASATVGGPATAPSMRKTEPRSVAEMETLDQGAE
jgi:flagellar motor switch protein FliM